jgi:hypothetical protein
MDTIKAGRPKKYDKVMYWGMKVTPEEKKEIKILSQIFKRPASHIILELVHKALADINLKETVPEKKRISTDELMKLPKKERSKILKEQAKLIAREYETDIIEYNEDITE